MQITIFDENGHEYNLRATPSIIPIEGERKFDLKDEDDNNWITVKENVSKNGFEILLIKLKAQQDQIETELSKLYIQIIESEQKGTEDTELNIEEENPYNPDEIKVNTKPFNLTLIKQMIDDGSLDLNPDFQRNFVWDTVRKSKLIESILLRIPLPMFYFAEDKEGNIAVVDGLQRLTTIKEFMENKFKLKGLEYLKGNCEGKYYKENSERSEEGIDSKYFRWFNMTQLTVNVIDPSSPSKVKFDIFRRINEGGKPLNNQEIRNCLATPQVRKLLSTMTNLIEFKSATDDSIKPSRMEDQEVVLRFIRFYEYYHERNNFERYNGNMESTLDDMIEDLNKKRLEELEKYIQPFKNAMINAEYLFGRYAFRKIKEEHIGEFTKKQLINKALFVSWSVLLSMYIPDHIKNKTIKNNLVHPLAKIISTDDTLFKYLTYGTNGKINIQEVFKACEILMSQNLELIKYEKI